MSKLLVEIALSYSYLNLKIMGFKFTSDWGYTRYLLRENKEMILKCIGASKVEPGKDPFEC